MKAAILLYLKCFLAMGVPFALLMTIFAVLAGEGFQLNDALRSLLIFGGWMDVPAHGYRAFDNAVDVRD